ncbi:DUF4097 family beta strand repeat-containing protein [Streptomyces sp. NPDC004667]|uniref:DUF4097 family beta strand repeat-containing protein n=1 Tax=Streptomyces sp. NPDC004667 TaxID=3154285 RepID=UPI0033B6CAA4
MQKFDTTAPVSVVLDIPAGRIRLVAADRADTTVEVRPADGSKSRDVKAAERTTVDYADGVLRIGAAEADNRILGNSGSIELTIQLPAGSHVEAKAAAAELRAVGRLGDVTFEGAQATVELDESAHTSLTVQAGDITVGRLTGPARISTQKGHLHIVEARRGTVELRTEHGDITVGAARGTSATLDAGTAYGRIHNSLGNADGADAVLDVRATTSYGDITARSL